jgi:hypothetical protein
MEISQGLTGEQHADRRPGPSSPLSGPSDSTWVRSPAIAKPDRATYEASRRAELDRIRLIDIKHRKLLVYFCPLGIHEIDHLWDDQDISLRNKEEHNKVESELYRCISATES